MVWLFASPKSTPLSLRENGVARHRVPLKSIPKHIQNVYIECQHIYSWAQQKSPTILSRNCAFTDSTLSLCSTHRMHWRIGWLKVGNSCAEWVSTFGWSHRCVHRFESFKESERERETAKNRWEAKVMSIVFFSLLLFATLLLKRVVAS